MSISIKPLASCVKKGRLEPYEADSNVVGTHSAEQPKGSGFIGTANILIDKLGETLKNSKPRVQIVEKIKYVNRDVPAHLVNGDEAFVSQPTGTVVIGVFNISRGAGATTMAVEIAKVSGIRGTKVYVIAADGSDDLMNAKVKEKNVRLSADKDIDASLMDAMLLGSQLIIIDFGVLADIDKNGYITSSLTQLSKSADRLATCKLRIAMGFGANWHLPKLKPFIDGKNTKIVPTHIILDKNVRGIDFPCVYSRDEMTPSAVVDDIGVTNKKMRRF
jgi:hypothetical protein